MLWLQAKIALSVAIWENFVQEMFRNVSDVHL